MPLRMFSKFPTGTPIIFMWETPSSTFLPLFMVFLAWDKYDSYYKQSDWLQVGAILDCLLLLTPHLDEKLFHFLVELSGVEAKNIRIVSFAFNLAWSCKDIISLRSFLYAGNF